MEQALETIVGLQQLQLKLYRARIAATPKCDALILIANRFQNHRRVFAALREFQCGVTQLVRSSKLGLLDMLLTKIRFLKLWQIETIKLCLI